MVLPIIEGASLHMVFLGTSRQYPTNGQGGMSTTPGDSDILNTHTVIDGITITANVSAVDADIDIEYDSDGLGTFVNAFPTISILGAAILPLEIPFGPLGAAIRLPVTTGWSIKATNALVGGIVYFRRVAS